MSVNPKRVSQVNGTGNSPGPKIPFGCLLCSEHAGKQGLCLPCQGDLDKIHAFCIYCGRPMSCIGVCGKCLNLPNPLWQYLYAAFDYTHPVSRLIHCMKYHGDINAAHVLAVQTAHAMEPFARKYGFPDVIVPVPLHPMRLALRGYNQALVIAEEIGKCLDIIVEPSLCHRTRHTPAQASLDATNRTRNLKNAFYCDADRCKGKTIAIVDDVITTASTVREVSQTMINAGARCLQIWAIARQQLHG